ncbi:hypothetical protein F5Y17DRAFT_32164 [Xylariaceae sp. FL0594]|nr:hypothetical protein F5Y17DRAFT_32164 [Xylariaceae sp. FL0594]
MYSSSYAAGAPYMDSHSIAGDSMYTPSNYSMASPSTAVSYPDTAAEPVPHHDLHSMAGRLPCEFVGYTWCDLTFPLNDPQSWIRHVLDDHLQQRLPRDARCWFCDDIDFTVSDRCDEVTNFTNRMRHIHDHFINGSGSVYAIRPDFLMNEHLWRQGLITDESYEWVKTRYEHPHVRGLKPRDFQPDGLWHREEGNSQAFSALEKEDRTRRREAREKEKERKGQKKNEKHKKRR